MATHTYRDLIVWQKGMKLVEAVYLLIQQLPPTEKYALADQMRRCAVSIPSNIAEGQKRIGKAEMAHFLSISLGSLAELETQLELCQRLYKIDIQAELALCTDVNRLGTALLRTLRTKN